MANLKSFLKNCYRLVEIEHQLNDWECRDEIGKHGVNCLEKEYTRLAKRVNSKCAEITEEQFFEIDIEFIACTPYELFKDGIFPEEFEML